jgi:phosphomannomutase
MDIPRVRAWIERDPDPETRRELEQLLDRENREEIEERFAGRLQFGTAGIRGIEGAGPTRMNRLVVRETTAGLAAYLLKTIPDATGRGVVVGYDARRGSKVFAEDTAGVLAGRGIKVFLTDREQPTPLCSFAVRDREAAAAIVVTASHNPPEYNGYKVYWQNGAQIIPPHDLGIAREIGKAAEETLPWLDPDDGRTRGLVVSLGNELVESYLEGLQRLSIHDPSPLRAEIALAYTPLHGVGAEVAEEALRRSGFEKVHSVACQREPDGRFPTVSFPNPEEPGAMDEVLALAKETSADLAFANDPDADRFATAVRRRDGSYRMLSGDQVGVLLGADILERARDPISVVTTIVSSRMLGEMARAHGADFVETLTGFKWIVNHGLAREEHGYRFAFGYEEALGYTIGSLVPDKDGISAMVAFAEMAVECRKRGMSVLDRLEELYRRYGLHVTAQKSLVLDPSTGGASAVLRESSPTRIGGRTVIRTLDVERGEVRYADGRAESSDLPESDVLVFDLEGEARVTVRPSGTEPKLKCYYEIRREMESNETLDGAEAHGRKLMNDLIDAHQQELEVLLSR